MNQLVANAFSKVKTQAWPIKCGHFNMLFVRVIDNMYINAVFIWIVMPANAHSVKINPSVPVCKQTHPGYIDMFSKQSS